MLVKVGLEDDCYVVYMELERSNFNTELLKRIFGMTFNAGNKVSACRKSKDYNVISECVKKFLELSKLLSL